MAEPPHFLRLAAHPVRWQLLQDLARSDRRVGELSERAGGRQSLVSYHLRQLRDGGLVSMRRSDADGRDSYYVLQLARCGELLADAGAALHPGLASGVSGERAYPRVRVLFLCTGNSARSQMAEAMIEQLSGGSISAASAGSRPKPLHPRAISVMRDRGIDISGNRPKHMDEFATERFDYVVSLCDRVREICPEFPGTPEVVHWSVADPSRGSRKDAFERTADELAGRIRFFIEAIQTTTTGRVIAHA